jgi:hypothetical protein
MFGCPSTDPTPFPSRRVRAADQTRHAELVDKFCEAEPYANLSPGETAWLKENSANDPDGMFFPGDGAILIGTLKGFDDWYNAEDVEKGIRYHPCYADSTKQSLSGIQARFYTEDRYQWE